MKAATVNGALTVSATLRLCYLTLNTGGGIHPAEWLDRDPERWIPAMERALEIRQSLTEGG